LDPDKSTLVFIHGTGGSGSFWQAQIDALAERVNTVAVDLPGHGRSDGPGKNKIADYARVVAEFVEELNLPGPIPCGISMGGAVVQLLLLGFPQRWRAGILISTGARLKVAQAIFETVQKDYAQLVAMLCKFAASKKTDPKLVQPFQEELSRCSPETTLGDFQACDRFDVIPRLSSIAVPVLVITAEDDQLTPPKYGDFLEKNIKHAVRIHLMDGGHIVPMEKPADVNAAMLEFLEREGLAKR
jgi:pimeloyl-ACP methyl ester carboxylesterase